MSSEELEDFMRPGRILSAKQVNGRGNDRTFLVLLDFEGAVQGFTGYYFGDDEKALGRLDSFCNDFAATFGVAQFEALEGMQVVALYDERRIGLNFSPIVGLMNPENGKKFIADEWFEKNCAVRYKSPLEEKQGILLARKRKLLLQVEDLDQRFKALERNVYWWRS